MKREENQTKNQIEKVKILIDSDTGAGKGGSYIKLCRGGDFSKWKNKTESLASQQGYKRFLIGQISVASE